MPIIPRAGPELLLSTEARSLELPEEGMIRVPVYVRGP
jgi:hypothetical protein